MGWSSASRLVQPRRLPICYERRADINETLRASQPVSSPSIKLNASVRRSKGQRLPIPGGSERLWLATSMASTIPLRRYPALGSVRTAQFNKQADN